MLTSQPGHDSPTTSSTRVGLVGAGGIAPSHVTAWRDLGIEVINFAEQGSAELCERFGLTSVGSLDELLAQVDVVDVSTPTPSHHPIAMAAFAAGKHVVTEKPLARTSEQAREMITAARAAGVQLHVTHVVRYFPAYASAEQAIRAGQLGQIAVQRHMRCGNRPDRGWFADPVASGGIVMDLMIHDIDFARWTAGEVVQVFARETDSLADPQAAAHAHVVLTHASGAVSECTANWRRGARFGTQFTIAGAGGTLSHDSLADPPFVLDELPAEEGGGRFAPSTPMAAVPHAQAIAEIHTSLTGGPEPRVTAADGLAALLISEAAAESVRTGAPVAVSSIEEVVA
ncbi:Gfo/Idh/MocA family protein [Microlunatus sp. Y2014]|uniref:Gfo/Idh/MocA family protein n=1 Tax=Microlunatus sp. Y2014 TaxID=3418488 RepID=UPI003DA72870